MTLQAKETISGPEVWKDVVHLSFKELVVLEHKGRRKGDRTAEQAGHKQLGQKMDCQAEELLKSMDVCFVLLSDVL